MNEVKQSESFFAKVRNLLWPIYGAEHKIWFPMATMVGLILFNYTVARNVKDGLVITATKSSEIIPYLKVTLVLPAAFIFFIIYSKLANMLDKRALFYTVIGGFIAYFIFFAAVLYPMHEYLHPTESADYLQSILPIGLKGLVDCYRVWTFSTFYIMSELWGAAVSALMFWQFANDVIRVSDAKRFYSHFYLLANAFVAFSGVVLNRVSQVEKDLPAGADPFATSLRYIIGIMTVSGFLVLAIYYYLNKFVFNEEYLAKVAAERSSAPKKKKVKMSVMEGIKYIVTNKYLGLIAILVISYGISINLIEVTWKNQVFLQFPSKNEYTAFMGYLTGSTGIATIICIFLGSILVRKLGWKIAALATPVVMGITGILFYLSVIKPELVAPLGIAFGISPLFLGVIIGLIQNVFSKSVKYALFDPTKEMAYIPLDDEAKMKGKAAVDVVANRFGKSGGGFIQVVLYAVLGSIGASVPYLAVLFVIVIIAWIYGASALSVEFDKASGRKN